MNGICTFVAAKSNFQKYLLRIQVFSEFNVVNNNEYKMKINTTGYVKHELLTCITAIFFCICCVLSSYAQIYTLNEQWVECGNSCKLLDPYYSPGVTFEWTGGQKDGKAHGIGKAIKYVNGKYESTYEGEYKNGIREGFGRFSHVEGTIQEGPFVKGQFSGKGIETMDSGAILKAALKKMF